MDRALQLINELDCGDIVDGVIDVHEQLPEQRVIHTTVQDILALLGVEVPTETVVSILNSLNLTCTLGEDGNSLSVTVRPTVTTSRVAPTWPRKSCGFTAMSISFRPRLTA